MKNLQQVFVDSFGGMCAQMWLNGREDELEVVHEGKLDSPTNSKGPDEIVIRPNQDAIAQEKADEDDEEIQEDLETRTPG